MKFALGMAHLFLHATVSFVSILVPMNFMYWKWKMRKGVFWMIAAPKQENKLRGITGKVIPMTANSNDYFTQLKLQWKS
uniref:Serpentine receptor class gamma n=1 Tax=Panagrellus redivivus TaxID=6233 RepID=A0A7E4ZYE3_PANRE